MAVYFNRLSQGSNNIVRKDQSSLGGKIWVQVIVDIDEDSIVYK